MEALAEGATIEKAYTSAGMASKTAMAFLARPDARKALNGYRAAHVLAKAAPLAMDTVLDLLEPGSQAPASTRSKLALGVLEMARKMEIIDFERDTEAPAVDNLSPEDLARLAARVREELASADAIEAAYTEIPPSPPESDLF